MQKLLVEFKNTSGDAPQVPCSVSGALNREETLSVPCIVLANNNSDEDLHSGKSRQDLRVPVLNMRGKPLMPMRPRKARVFLKQEKAAVVQRSPFIIQLKYPSGETKQALKLGIDAGYSTIGFSAINDKSELLSGELTLRKRISKLLEQKKHYRRARRNKLWYRKPKFNNRSKPKGWFAPSIQHKLETHLRLIEKLTKILPVTKITVEVSSFDQQKMQNPEINGVEYHQGELQSYEVREYLLEKWKHKCAYCGKSNTPLEIEHIIPKIRGGTDRVSNLTLACHKCNQKKGDKTAAEVGYPEIQKKANQTLKTTAFMNIVRWRLVNTLKCDWTYGYITKHARIKLDMEKSHINDAFVIAGGTTQSRSKPYKVTQTRRNNRSIQTNRKGFKPSIRKQRYKLQPNDLVKYIKSLCKVKGVHNYGEYVIVEGKIGKIFDINVKKVELLKYGKGIQF
ncbi:MAG TPA: paclitaxel/taxanoid biosynthesis susceptibility protein TS1 [Euryarchaeota archaeon]|nr:paclitaxel/taxanoid biosynthesis susceptibility protein TS1 [Euryarchaeota archaeon]